MVYALAKFLAPTKYSIQPLVTARERGFNSQWVADASWGGVGDGYIHNTLFNTKTHILHIVTWCFKRFRQLNFQFNKVTENSD